MAWQYFNEKLKNVNCFDTKKYVSIAWLSILLPSVESLLLQLTVIDVKK